MSETEAPVPAPSAGEYDPNERLVRRPFASNPYHTKIRAGVVHPIRDSLFYAVHLYAVGTPTARERGAQILRRVISLQDQDEQSPTHGIWAWFLEEPLSEMAPPDFNWADFCGVALLEIAREHREQLDTELAQQVDDAIRHAARSIRRRDVAPSYTNIAIMGTYVTLAAGQHLSDQELVDYALQRLRRFYEYTLQTGAFTEYNSPTYTLIALEELGRLRQVAPAGEPARMTEELYRIAWEEIAQHFHPPTCQWAGPHSRSYSSLLGHNALRQFERSSGLALQFPVGKPARKVNRPRGDMNPPLPMPPDLLPLFQSLQEPRTVVRTYDREKPPLVGTSYLHPRFALGSASRGSMWNQQRPLIGYWGTQTAPAYLQVRLLRDAYDFDAAMICTRQEAGLVLAGIRFATNGGLRHPHFDRMKEGKFTASDLRLRFEFGGSARHLPMDMPGGREQTVTLVHEGIHIQLNVPVVRFGETTGRWEASHAEKAACLDIVLYEGPERQFDLTELTTAVIGLAVRMSDQPPPPLVASAEIADEQMLLRAETLSLSVGVRPGTREVLRADAR